MSCALFTAVPSANAKETSDVSTNDKSDETTQSNKSEGEDGRTSAVLQTQVLLDRVLFSPGAIDGLEGRNFKLALTAFQKANGLKASGEMDQETSDTLRGAAQVSNFIETYTVTEADSSTKFLKAIPEDRAKVAELDALSYASISELLAERFHTNSETLAYLNPGAQYKVNDKISVPNVFPTTIRNGKPEEDKEGNNEPETDKSSTNKDDKDTSSGGDRLESGLAEKPEGPVTVIVTKQDSSLNVVDEDGKVIFHAPVSAGSEHDPLPLGKWKVNGTERYPKFHYNPDLFWDADESDKKAKLPAGPNNPVGVAWVDISKPHYGLHGTPDPSKIGYTESHGCVRLTNWDILRLADMVKPGTKVEFLEKLANSEE